MDSAALLSPTDVNTIRRYVRTKYAPLSGDRQAEIVADAVRRTLERRLPDLPERLKIRLVDQLISRCLIDERRDVLPDDVLDHFAEWEDDYADGKEQLIAPILAWMNERSPGRWSEAQLTSRLDRRKGLALAVVQDVAIQEESNRSLIDRVDLLLAEARRRLSMLIAPIPAAGALTAAIAIVVTMAFVLKPSDSRETELSGSPRTVASPAAALPDVGMPMRLKYTEVNAEALKDYLNSRDSLLADEPYFGAIMASALQYDIHPLLLFAITGQEQGFVPRSGKDAKLIANNPFNVGHSWMEYNTDTRDSANIASKLLVKLANSRPEGAEPFEWFNQTYAEDPLWSDGVHQIFDKLVSLPSIIKAE